ncbi:MAG: toll/interleukin-1 receptor domain-containing protein [Burkholderiaceae bacterium]
MGSIFINYRRGETAGEAMALFNQLAAALGKDSVFMDVANLDLGRDFREALNERLASCDLMLAIVGRGWVEGKSASGRCRLEEPNDYVRLEIAAALKRNIPVLPVLVQGARMPSAEELPEDLANFAFRNAFELSHNRWDSDVREMLKRLGLGDGRPAEGGAERAGPAPKALAGVLWPVAGAVTGSMEPTALKRRLAAVAALLVAVALAAGGWLYFRAAVEEASRAEAAKAKAAAEAELASVKADAAKARAAAEAASSALATAQIEKQVLIAVRQRYGNEVGPESKKVSRR